MISRIIDFSLNNKLIISLLTLVLIAWGVYNFTILPVDAVPDITNNQVQVVTISQSLAPQEVEQFITYPVEMAMANIQDVTEIRSISRFGLSVVTIVFKDNVDTYLARQLVNEQMKVAESEIPEGYGEPEMMPVTTGLGEIYQYVVEPLPGYEHKYYCHGSAYGAGLDHQTTIIWYSRDSRDQLFRWIFETIPGSHQTHAHWLAWTLPSWRSSMLWKPTTRTAGEAISKRGRMCIISVPKG